MPLRSILKMRFCYPVRVHKRKIRFSCFKNYLNENCFFFSIPSWSQQYYQIHNMKGHLAFTPFLLAESYLRCFWMNARSEGHRFQWMLGQVPKFCFAKIQILWNYFHLNSSKDSPMGSEEHNWKKACPNTEAPFAWSQVGFQSWSSSPLKTVVQSWQIWVLHVVLQTQKVVRLWVWSRTFKSQHFHDLHLGNLDSILQGWVFADLPVPNFTIIENVFLII